MAGPVHTLLSSDGAGITLDPLLYGAYRNTDGLSNPGLSSTMAGPVHTLLSSDGAGITLDPLLYGAYRNTDGLSNPGLSSTMAGPVHHFSPRPQMA